MALGHDTLLQKTVLTGQPQFDGTDTTGIYWYMGLVDSKAARRASSATSRDSKAVSLARTASMLLIEHALSLHSLPERYVLLRLEIFYPQ